MTTHATTLQTTFSFPTAIPDTDTLPPHVRYVPEPLHIPVDAIQRPEDLPPFLLLGQRDGESFERTADGFFVEYVWPAFGEGPVARIECSNRRFFVHEHWQGEHCGTSTGAGETLAEGLSYHFGATLTTRDAETFAGLDVSGNPHGPATRIADPREIFFQDLFTAGGRVTYQRPWPGTLSVVHVPGGIDKALVIPCFSDDTRSRLVALYEAYNNDGGAYRVDGLPERLRFGSFFHRRATVVWGQARATEPSDDADTEYFVYVGPWRAAVELGLQVQDAFHDVDPSLPGPFICSPQQLYFHYGLTDCLGNRSAVTPLLPPQEAYGISGAPKPEPLTEWPESAYGGPSELLTELDAALDRGLPRKAHVYFDWPEPEAPRFLVIRDGHYATPSLCAYLLDGVPDYFKLHRALLEHTKSALPFSFTLGRDAKAIFIPNVPSETLCGDPEGFYYLLPDFVRFLTEEYRTAWRIVQCNVYAEYPDADYPLWYNPGPRKEGWA